MDKPVCRLCGHKHDGLEHVFDTPQEPLGKKPAKVTTPTTEKHKPVKRWDKESWNAYMKEYMKEYRTRKRAEKMKV